MTYEREETSGAMTRLLEIDGVTRANDEECIKVESRDEVKPFNSKPKVVNDLAQIWQFLSTQSPFFHDTDRPLSLCDILGISHEI